MNNLTHIFCGNYGGGTSFTANYLTYCGFPCCHEMLHYNPVTSIWNYVPNGMIEYDGIPLYKIAKGESNYTAMEYCNYEPISKLPIVLIYRNPISVLNSHLCIQINHGEIFDVNSAMENLIQRYQKIQNHTRVELKIRIEDQLEILCDYLGIQYKKPVDINSKKHVRGRTKFEHKDFIKYKNYSKFNDFCLSIGYSVTV